MTRSGRWRRDSAVRTQQPDDVKNPSLNLDTISEVPGAPQDVEDDPPELNEDTGLAYNVKLPDPIPIIQVKGGVPQYRRSTFHGYTANCLHATPKQIAMAQDHRVRIRLRNYETSATEGGYTVYIGSTQDEVVADGYPLQYGEEILIESTEAIWGLGKGIGFDASDYILVGVLAEYEWPVR